MKTNGLETFIDFLGDRCKFLTRKEIDSLIKKIDQSLERLKLPTRTEFNQLIKRVEQLEKGVRGPKETPKKTARHTQPPKKTAAKKKPPSRGKAQATDSEKVLEVMRSYPEGVNVATVKARTGFESKKIHNIVSLLSKKGQIRRVSRGIYTIKT